MCCIDEPDNSQRLRKRLFADSNCFLSSSRAIDYHAVYRLRPDCERVIHRLRTFCLRLTLGSGQGTIGSGCARDAMGTRYDLQNIPAGGTILLQSYDFTKSAGATNPFYQYMRSVNGNWGTGLGNTAATHFRTVQ